MATRGISCDSDKLNCTVRSVLGRGEATPVSNSHVEDSSLQLVSDGQGVIREAIVNSTLLQLKVSLGHLLIWYTFFLYPRVSQVCVFERLSQVSS